MSRLIGVMRVSPAENRAALHSFAGGWDDLPANLKPVDWDDLIPIETDSIMIIRCVGRGGRAVRFLGD
jgi:hypothetical protein